MRFISFVFAGLLIHASMFAQTLVKGTGCTLSPPKGFVSTTAFSGFQHPENGSSIMVNEVPSPYKATVVGMTETALKNKGMSLLKSEDIQIQSTEGKLMFVSQVANGSTYFKYLLLFGSETNTVMVTGIYPESAKSIGDEIKTAVLSTTYQAQPNQNPLDAANCVIDPTGTGFKPVKYMSGSLIYSLDDKLPTTKPIIILANSISKVQIASKKDFAIERLKKMPRGDKMTIKSTTPIEVDGMSGFEIVADGKTKDDEPELVYQVMLFDDEGNYYLFVGQAKDDMVEYLNTFKSLAKTIKRK